jgi:hypothetical protein
MVETKLGLRRNSSYSGLMDNGSPIRRLDAAFFGMPNLTLMILGSLCVLLGVLTFGGVPAWAAVTHDFSPE